MMHESVLIEVHVVTKEKKTLLDIDCVVDIDRSLFDLIDIVFKNYHLDPDRIIAMYAFIPLKEDPLELYNSDYQKTMRALHITNGITFRMVYSGGE